MSIHRHGLSIGLERHGRELLLALKIVGKLTHEDYELMVPMLESALKGIKQPTIKAVVDCTELDGWELNAMWDDFKFGTKYRQVFSKIALVGNRRWHRVAGSVGSWFISGELSYFENYASASSWLLQTTKAESEVI